MGFLGDRPLGSDGQDRLGFEPLAKRIATSLMDRASSGGLVIGIEGAWGSGKTSLIDLTIKHLHAVNSDNRPIIVNFKPWLIGDRDALLTALFRELASAADAIALEAGNAGPATKTKAKEVAEKIRNFGSKLGGVGSAIALAGQAVPGLGLVGNAVTALADAASDSKSDKSLADTKDDLVESLAELDRRIIVTVDDVDRLDPMEALEILRLVRSVGDFPNVIYLLCYDLAVLSNGIKEAAKVQDGRVFLDKIIQATVRVPVPEEFRLRNWFEDELRKFATPKTEEQAQRLSSVIMTDGDLWLKTPRAVVKLLDELRFYWPAIESEGGDIADLVWLRLIKSGCPQLYDWVERYCSIMSVMSLGIGRATDMERIKFKNEFSLITNRMGLVDIHYYAHFAEHLLGVRPNYSKDEEPLNIFDAHKTIELDNAISNKRLKSPDHHRLYFALDLPSHSIRQSDYDAFWAATDDSGPALDDLLKNWADVPITRTFSKCQLLLERVAAAPTEQFPPDRAERILLSFGTCMDYLFEQARSEDLFGPTLWRKTQEFVITLRDRIPEPRRSKFFKELFEMAPALGWLSYLFRHDVFGQGVFGNESTQESDWLFSDKLFKVISKIMLKRYKASTLDEILSIPNAGTVFHTWRQAGDAMGAKEKIKVALTDDTKLFDVLEILTSKIGTSDGTFKVLRRSDVEDFFDFDYVVAKLLVITKKAGPLKQRAAKLMKSIELAKDY